MKHLVFILSLTIALFSQAQTAKELTNWSAQFSTTTYNVGDEIEVIITATINQGWHLYSSDFDPNCGPIPTTINFTENSTYQTVGELKAINPHKKFDEIFECDITEFSKIGVFKQKIKVLKKDINIVAKGNYQICQDMGMCLMGKISINETATPSNQRTIHVIQE